MSADTTKKKVKKRVIERGDVAALGRWATRPVHYNSSHDNALSNVTINKAAKDSQFQKGYDEGFDQGLREGRDAAQKELQKKMQQFDQLMRNLSQPFASLDEQAEGEFVRLALSLARQIIRREIQTQPGQIVAVVREALSILSGSVTDIKIHVHPDDAQTLREHMSSAEQERTYEVVDDSTISRGGCRVRSSSSIIDATIEKQFAKLSAQFLGDERGDEEVE